MSKCQKLDDGTFLLSEFSKTEVNKHFIKFSSKIMPSEFKDSKISRKFKIRQPNDKLFECKWGTENRMYLNEKYFSFDADSKIKVRFLNSNELELIT